MNRIELSSGQVASVWRALECRERDIVEQVLQQPDYPPLPPCPECGAAAEQMESMMEPPRFGVHEQAILINVKPCWHKFRAVVDIDQFT
ncbi:hypothetical protein [Streptomyces sp. SID8499]|uniref:hypothetical protein n=1 Tax=Streptomyces sp. SID8499 TaxID=2706106 RepID=UPI0013CAA169|nr:hypothetical protein [Streptomyces sp. SID8499]NED31090.1 hypothetical protein [Streptomyces sp. SID8499]